MDIDEALRKMFLAGVGAVSMTGEKAKELVEELVKRGELSVAQGKVINEELQHKIKTKVQSVVGCKPSMDNVAECVEKMSAAERAELRRKMDEMDRAAAQPADETAENANSETTDEEKPENGENAE